MRMRCGDGLFRKQTHQFEMFCAIILSQYICCSFHPINLSSHIVLILETSSFFYIPKAKLSIFPFHHHTSNKEQIHHLSSWNNQYSKRLTGPLLWNEKVHFGIDSRAFLVSLLLLPPHFPRRKWKALTALNPGLRRSTTFWIIPPRPCHWMKTAIASASSKGDCGTCCAEKLTKDYPRALVLSFKMWWMLVRYCYEGSCLWRSISLLFWQLLSPWLFDLPAIGTV